MMTDPAASGPGTHLAPDRMADLVEGLLDAVSADEARAHLASCAVCAADFAIISGEGDLHDLSGLLPPVPIPQDVVTRIEAALDREPALGTGSASDGAATGAGAANHAAATSPRRRRPFRITLGALAGGALVVAGGFGVVAALSNTSESKSSSGASSAAGRAPASPSAGGSHAPGKAPNEQMSPKLDGGPDTGASGTPGTSGYQDLSIEQQAIALIGQHAESPANGTTTGGGPQCSPQGPADSARPLAETETVYEGRTVWLVVYAESGTATMADVYVVDADSCTPGATGLVLDRFEIPRS